MCHDIMDMHEHCVFSHDIKYIWHVGYHVMGMSYSHVQMIHIKYMHHAVHHMHSHVPKHHIYLRYVLVGCNDNILLFWILHIP